MIILSHRGYWQKPSEKNTDVAFQRSFALGFGTETDVRDACGQLLISHDMPVGHEMTLDNFFSLSVANLPLAINVKSDGLARAVGECARRNGVSNWFAFDMSIPDMRAYLKEGCPVYCRMSEVERLPPWRQDCAGVWLDSFGPEWYGQKELEALLETGQALCVVSSELHGREPEALWRMLKPLAHMPQLMICTDMPEAARTFFEQQEVTT